MGYVSKEWLKENGFMLFQYKKDADVARGDVRAIKVMLAKWKMEQENAGGCSADACLIKF